MINKFKSQNNEKILKKDLTWFMKTRVFSVLENKNNLDIINDLYLKDKSILSSYNNSFYTISYEDLFSSLKKSLINEKWVLSFDFLKTLNSDNRKIDLSILLIHIWVDNILNLFWKKVLFWTLFNYPYLWDFLSSFEEKILEKLSMNKKFFSKAKFNSFYFGINDDDIETILKNYELLDYLNSSDYLKKIDKNELINQNKIDKNLKIKDSTINNYEFIVFNTDNYDIWYVDEPEINTENNIYLDSLLWIGVYYKKNPNLVFSFKATNKNTLQLVQIQWIKPIINWKKTNSKGLHIIDWKSLAVYICEDISKKLNFKNIEIVSWKNNIWTKNTYSDLYFDKKLAWKVKFPLENAIKIYDNTAIKNWYSLNYENDNFIKQIK